MPLITVPFGVDVKNYKPKYNKPSNKLKLFHEIILTRLFIPVLLKVKKYIFITIMDILMLSPVCQHLCVALIIAIPVILDITIVADTVVVVINVLFADMHNVPGKYHGNTVKSAIGILRIQFATRIIK